MYTHAINHLVYDGLENADLHSPTFRLYIDYEWLGNLACVAGKIGVVFFLFFCFCLHVIALKKKITSTV